MNIDDYYDRITLEKVKFAIQGKITHLALVSSQNVELTIKRFAHDLAVRLEAFIAKQQLEYPVVEFVCRYPKTWWQAFKQRFFPLWALKKWPVKLITIKETHCFNVSALYPQLAFPKEQHTIQVMKFDPNRKVLLDD